MDILYDENSSSETNGKYVNLLDNVGLSTFSALQEAAKDYHKPVYKDYKQRNPQCIWKAALTSDRVQCMIGQIVREESRERCDVLKEAEAILKEMAFTDHMTFVRMLGFCLFKIQQYIYPEGIYVNRSSIDKMKDIITKHPVVFMPSHRSYMDFLIFSVTCFCLNLPLPAIAAGMDFMGMKFVGYMLRSSGAFFMRRSFGTDRLYWALFTEYAHTILINGDRPMEFFIEGTRSRTGKSLTPKFGLLSVIAEPYLKAQTYDVAIVPVSITYDRMLEETLYAYELLGVPKPKESTSGLFKASSILKENYGSIHIQFGKMISLRKEFNGIDRAKHAFCPRYLLQLSEVEAAELKKIGFNIVQQQQENMIFTPWPIIAMVLSIHSDGVAFNFLVSELQWLKNIVACSSIRIRWPHFSMEEVVKRCLIKFRHLVHRRSVDQLNPEADVVEVLVDTSTQAPYSTQKVNINSSTLNHIILANYRNQILFGLIRPGILSLCLRKSVNYTGGTFEKKVFMHEFKFLRDLLCYEFVFQPDQSESDLTSALVLMHNCGIVHYPKQTAKSFKVESHAARFVTFFQDLFSVFLITYWLTAMYFIHNKPCSYVAAKSKVQLWISKLSLPTVKPESLSLNLLSNALLSLKDLGGLQLIKTQNIKVFSPIPQKLKSLSEKIASFIKVPSKMSFHILHPSNL